MSMTNPDFRALCEQLMELAEGKRYDGSAVIAKARTALAQQHVRQPYELPEPVAPTDEELLELMPQQMRDDLANAARALAGFDRANVKAAGAMRIILNRQVVNHARAVLARWGQP
jgi:hypothetical protein